MDDLLFNRQFVLSKENTFPFPQWRKQAVADFTLFYHPNLTLSTSSLHDAEIFLLGYAFDPENPRHTDKEIVHDLLKESQSFEQIINNSAKYSGQFIIIYKKGAKLFLFNDACAQREVYYTTDFSTFGSQVALLGQVRTLEAHGKQEAIEFYHSTVFNRKKLFIGAETNKANVKHLRPNHYLDIAAKKSLRFFPAVPLQNKSVKEAAEEVAAMLKAILKAVNYRFKIALPVTAGYDSRVLFGASLGLDCRYFVFKHRKLHNKHPDITIPQQLLERFSKKLEIISYPPKPDPKSEELHRKSIDFYRPDNTATIFNAYKKHFHEYIILNGNISEIARSFYGNFQHIKGKKLAYFSSAEEYPYAVKVYEAWVKENKDSFQANGYNLLDMFYWEERMGNWAAKGKTEALLGAEFFSPFNSRKLISFLLSVDRKYRDTQPNQLFDEVLRLLSPALLKEPINPDPKTKAIIMMKKFGLYDMYRNIGLKYRFLKF